MWSKIRPNALIIAVMLGALVGLFGWLLYQQVASIIDDLGDGVTVSEGVIAMILALAASTFTPLGGLLSLAGQMATDPEPNPIIEYVRVAGTDPVIVTAPAADAHHVPAD